MSGFSYVLEHKSNKLNSNMCCSCFFFPPLNGWLHVYLFLSRSTANVPVHQLSEGLVNQGVEGADQPPTTPQLSTLPVQIPQAGHLVLGDPRHAPL